MIKSDTIIELGAALSKAQGELSNASKSSANPFFKSKYADLAECINVVRPVFAVHGLSITQMPSYESGIVSVESMLIHSSGEWISSTISAPVGKQDAQGVGSAITYCRRYSLAAIAGIAQEDDDGNGAVGKTSPKKPTAEISLINKNADNLEWVKEYWNTTIKNNWDKLDSKTTDKLNETFKKWNTK